jgi:hypothetical protein
MKAGAAANDPDPPVKQPKDPKTAKDLPEAGPGKVYLLIPLGDRGEGDDIVMTVANKRPLKIDITPNASKERDATLQKVKALKGETPATATKVRLHSIATKIAKGGIIAFDTYLMGDLPEGITLTSLVEKGRIQADVSGLSGITWVVFEATVQKK